VGVATDRLAVSGRLRRRVVRATETALVVLGVAFVIASTHSAEIPILGAWDVLAGAYLALGALVVWRPLPGADPDPDAASDPVVRHWSGMVFTVSASVIGMVAATRVIVNAQTGTSGAALTILAVAAMILAWTLVHAGFARLYSAAYHRPGTAGGGLEFPHGERPGRVEFVYFAFTVGVSFAVSDVTVTRSDMRWRVLVHEILSFFYNAAVIALAISTLTDL
jgi:uncharacterized membrane protein